MLHWLPSAAQRGGVLFVVGLLASAACSLTEEVRTRPGGPGEIGFDPGTGGRRYITPTDSGIDGGGRDGEVDGARAGSGGRGTSGAGGAGGRSGGGGRAGHGGGASTDAGPEPDSCPVEVTFACHDYCGALSLVPECLHKLEEAAGVKPDGGAYFPDGSVPHELATPELVTRCKCDCELRYRTPACRYEFDQFIMCATPPLTVVCATDPDLLEAFPSVIGPCGSLRSAFVECLVRSPPPPPPIPDGGS